MTQNSFTPTSVTIDPPPPPDYLAGAVIQALSRPIGGRLSWGVVKSLVLATFSFGVLPLLSWIHNFRRFAVAEQQQFLHLAQWVRQNSDHQLARQLENDAADLSPRGLLTFVSIFALLFAALSIAFDISRINVEPFDAILAGTYGLNRAQVLDFRVYPIPNARHIFDAWFYGLTIAYGFHWLQLQLHAQDVKRFVSRFSQIAKAEGVNGVRAESLGPPISPVWFAAAVVLFKFGAPWGVAAMLAGAAQRRYITTTSRNTRADVAHRLRALLMRKRPSTIAAAAAPMPVYLRERCVEPRCRAEILRAVNFCPRCGTRQRAPVNRVA